MKRFLVVLVSMLTVFAAMTAVAQESATLTVREDPVYGSYLADADGMTLYMYTRDLPNQSNCYDQCAEAWPPFTVEGELSLPEDVPGTLGTITRDDGTTQVTYNEMPLYYWQADTQPGDTTGQGVGGVWFIVAPGADFPSFGVMPQATPMASPGPETAGTVLLIRRSPELGDFLIDSNGMTLYLFTRDETPGESACYDDCATRWPPLTTTGPVSLAPGIPGEVGTITRTDGTMQVTYNGMPLYYYADDTEAGDTNGQGAGDVWFVVQVVPPASTPEAGTPMSG
ncbi:MAG TPA: hypothetical protein VIL01_00625 [Thermomicrobiales bacterium]